MSSSRKKKIRPSASTKVRDEMEELRTHTQAVNAAVHPLRSRMKNQSLALAWKTLALIIDGFIVASVMLIMMPMVALTVAQSNQITTRSNGVNIIGLWLVPMIFFAVFMAAVIFVLTRRIWLWGVRKGDYARLDA